MKALLRIYSKDVIVVDGVSVEVLRLEKEQEVEVSAKTASQEVEKLYEMLAIEVERYRRDSKGYLVELRLTHPELREELAFGEQTARRRAKSVVVLFPEPARLRRVAVIREGQSTFSMSSLKWVEVKGDVYVFEGAVVMEDRDVKALVLDTDKGVKVVVID